MSRGRLFGSVLLVRDLVLLFGELLRVVLDQFACDVERVVLAIAFGLEPCDGSGEALHARQDLDLGLCVVQ